MIPKEDMQSLQQAIRKKGKRTGITSDLLTNIIDENIYDQITNPSLPAVYGQMSDHHLAAVKTRKLRLEAFSEDEDDDITLRLPVVRRRWVQPEMFADEESDITLRLPVVQVKQEQSEAVGELQ
ncbi:MAG: hypothetical protein ACRDHW_06310, partial [Ktedonobacteraceae bacterium]